MEGVSYARSGGCVTGLSASKIGELLEEALPSEAWAHVGGLGVTEKLATYLELLQRWNGVVSLTSVTVAEEIVRRHFAESVFAGWVMPACESLLDLGSGAGFPGVPIQLMRPELEVVLAEANGRKAAFLRELVRELGLRSRVSAGRVEGLAGHSSACVCLRAVDPMRVALAEASRLARRTVAVLGSAAREGEYGAGLAGWQLTRREEMSARGAAVFVFGR